MGAAWLAAKHVNYELPRDDSAFCTVFYTYHPEEMVNGNGDAVNGKALNVKLNGNGIANGNGSIHTEEWS